MSENTEKNEELKNGFDRIEEMEVNELSQDDLQYISGGEETNCTTWCCLAEV